MIETWTGGDATLYRADAHAALATLPDGYAQACVTSPPYFRQRRYLNPADPDAPLEIGTEPTPEHYVERLVEVFRTVRRVLRPDGVLFLNLAVTYAAGRGQRAGGELGNSLPMRIPPGYKVKDMIAIPWLVGLALQRDGWWLRQDVIWSIPNRLPDAARDRCSRAHEYVLLLSPSQRYYWNAAAVREPATGHAQGSVGTAGHHKLAPGMHHGRGRSTLKAEGRTWRAARSVWTIPTAPARAVWSAVVDVQHHAAFPSELARRCVLASTPPAACGRCGAPLDPPRWDCACGADQLGALVLDPFMGSATVGEVCGKLGRRFVGVELSRDSFRLSVDRLTPRLP